MHHAYYVFFFFSIHALTFSTKAVYQILQKTYPTLTLVFTYYATKKSVDYKMLGIILHMYSTSISYIPVPAKKKSTVNHPLLNG